MKYLFSLVSDLNKFQVSTSKGTKIDKSIDVTVKRDCLLKTSKEEEGVCKIKSTLSKIASTF